VWQSTFEATGVGEALFFMDSVRYSKRMNRTGLTVAFSIASVVGLIFGLYPELDVNIARLFVAFGQISFGLRVNPVVMQARDAAFWIEAALAAFALISLLVKLFLPRAGVFFSGRAALFLLVTLVVGPGLFVNVLTKEHWGRPRPIDIPEFGGDEPFVAWWDPRGVCPRNCSFVAGEPSGAIWLVSAAALAPPAW
jgi:lipid A 4'-phosphatase